MTIAIGETVTVQLTTEELIEAAGRYVLDHKLGFPSEIAWSASLLLDHGGNGTVERVVLKMTRTK